MLVRAGIITEDDVREALVQQKRTGDRLGETLVAMGKVTERQMTQQLSNQLTIPWVNLYHVDFSRELLDLVPADLAEHYELIPVYVRSVRRQGDTLYVAMTDPLNLEILQQVADEAGLPVKPMVANPTDIRNAIRVYYLGLAPLEEEEPKAEREPAAEESEPAPDEPTPEPVPSDEGGPSARPSQPPPPRPAAAFMTLTLLDGTQVKLPSPAAAGAAVEPEERGLTTRDLIHALNARAAGEDVSDVLPDDAWEPLVATLLSVLLRKGLIADWEFVDEWKKQRTTGDG